MALLPAQLYQLSAAQQALAAGLNADQQAYLSDLTNRLIALKAIRFSPNRSVRFKDGTTVTYDTPEELGNEIAAAQAEIDRFLQEIGGTPRGARFLRVGHTSGFHG